MVGLEREFLSIPDVMTLFFLEDENADELVFSIHG